MQSKKEARSLKFMKRMNCTICVAKTNVLISCAVTLCFCIRMLLVFSCKSLFVFDEMSHEQIKPTGVLDKIFLNKSAAGMHDTPPRKSNLVQMHRIS